MKTRLLSLPLLLVLVASLAACGGGAQKVPADAIAVVNGTSITIAQFNNFFAQAKAIATAQGQTVTPGTATYTTMRDQVTAYLVQVTEVEQQAAKEGVSESSSSVTKFIANLAKTQFSGSMSKLTAALKKEGLTMDTAKQEVFFNLLLEKLKKKVTATASVTEKQEQDYFNANPTQFAPQPTVDVAASKKLANTIEQKLKNGASFAKLAKQYSQDPGSASQGGKYTATDGREVPAYDKAAFSLKTGVLSAPIDATATTNGGYGFFIIKALAPVKKTGNPAQKTRDVEHILVSVKTTPPKPTFKQVQATIHQTLLQQAQDALWTKWLADLTKNYQGKVGYQSGYAPPTTTAISTSSLPPATTG